LLFSVLKRRKPKQRCVKGPEVERLFVSSFLFLMKRKGEEENEAVKGLS
jgi:hypothetical protein